MLSDLTDSLALIQTFFESVSEHEHLEEKFGVDRGGLVILQSLRDEVVDNSLVFCRFLALEELDYV